MRPPIPDRLRPWATRQNRLALSVSSASSQKRGGLSSPAIALMGLVVICLPRARTPFTATSSSVLNFFCRMRWPLAGRNFIHTNSGVPACSRRIVPGSGSSEYSLLRIVPPNAKRLMQLKGTSFSV